MKKSLAPVAGCANLPFMPTLADWLQWKQTCALDLCLPQTQAALRAMVQTRFSHYASVYTPSLSHDHVAVTAPESREAWHCFETYFQLHRTRQGKGYKEWLWARGPDPSQDPAAALEALESGVSLLLRNIVREHLRLQHPHPRLISTQKAITTSDGHALTLEDLLPDSTDILAEVERHEIEAMTGSIAIACFNDLATRERIALLTRELGITCRHPGAQRAAGCNRTALAKAFPDALKKIADHVEKANPAESRRFLAALTVVVFEDIRQKIFRWLEADKTLSHLLNTTEP